MEKFEQKFEEKKEKTVNSDIKVRKSSILKVVGATPEREEIIKKRFEKKFEEGGSHISEREKTAEEIELIEELNKYLSEFVNKYSGEFLEIPSENICFIDHDKVDVEMKLIIENNPSMGGFFYLGKQKIIILSEAPNILILAGTLVHEMLHFNSYQSITKGEGGSKKRKMGIRMFSDKMIYYNYLDEAIIEELAKRFDKLYFHKMPILQQEIASRKKIVDSLLNSSMVLDVTKDLAEDARHVSIEQKDGGGKRRRFFTRPYSMERQRLKKLIEDIYLKNKEKFSSEEDVFNIFAESVFGRHALKLARLIKNTYGQGAFRTIGETFGEKRA